MATELQNPPTRRPPAQLSGNITTAVLVATAPADDGGPAAALPWDDATLVERLLAQLAEIGVPHGHVLTRPEWEDPIRRAAERLGVDVGVHVSGGISEDLARIAAIGRES